MRRPWPALGRSATGNSEITVGFSGQAVLHGVSTSIKSVKNYFLLCETSEIHQEFLPENFEARK